MPLLRCERRWLAVVFDAILPGSGAEARRFALDFWRIAPARMRLAVRVALWAIVLSPIAVLGRWRTFAGLAPAERLECLRRLTASRRYLVRELPNVLKGVAALGYCGVGVAGPREST